MVQCVCFRWIMLNCMIYNSLLWASCSLSKSAPDMNWLNSKHTVGNWLELAFNIKLMKKNKRLAYTWSKCTWDVWLWIPALVWISENPLDFNKSFQLVCFINATVDGERGGWSILHTGWSHTVSEKQVLLYHAPTANSLMLRLRVSTQIFMGK